jgi:dihydrodipicolinate synthase/N-acetylneuraminate lyase
MNENINKAGACPVSEWRGIIPPMVTPLRGPDALDEAGLERLVEHILAGGVHGLFVLGTTGEGPSLSYRLRRELIRRVCRQVAGRVPVVAGISDTAFEESVSLAEAAAEAGVAAVVATPPYYLPVGQPELLEYLEHLVARLPLPLLLYNMPSCTKVAYAPETVRAAADIPGIIGIKDSSGDLDYFRTILKLAGEKPGFAVFMGPEELMSEAVGMGASGGVTGGANLFPELYVRLYEAAVARDAGQVESLQCRVMAVSRALYRLGRHPSSYLKGVKCALACMGLCDDFMAEPFHRFREPEREQLRQELDGLGHGADGGLRIGVCVVK